MIYIALFNVGKFSNLIYISLPTGVCNHDRFFLGDVELDSFDNISDQIFIKQHYTKMQTFK